jgi:hypothetical protein
MSSLAADIDFNRLNSLLWRYRTVLDRFEFLLEMQLAVSASGRQEWQHHMADLLDDLAHTIGTLDLEREIVLGDGVTLTDLAANAPEMWSTILVEQQTHLTRATAHIGRLRQRNQHAIEAGAAGLARLVDAIAEASGMAAGPSAESYGEDGRMRHEGGSALLFDGRF